jgi:multiple sugar transport system permease protein
MTPTLPVPQGAPPDSRELPRPHLDRDLRTRLRPGLSLRPGLLLTRRRRQRLAANLGLLVVAAAFVVPLLWLVFASLDAHATLKVSPPGSPTLDNFSAVLTEEITFQPMLNSLLICGGATLMTMGCAALAAYPLSRFRSRFSRPYLLTILFTTCLPITAVMVPVYGLFVQVNLIDTRYGTAFFLAASQLPFAVFLMKNFMDGVPVVLEEAAWTDGASWRQSLLRVILPLMGPGLAVVTIYSFIMMWGNFFVPFMLLLSPEKLPASVSIFTFFGNYGAIAFGQLAAFSVLYSTPVILLYVLISRRLGGGFALGGAVKG